MTNTPDPVSGPGSPESTPANTPKRRERVTENLSMLRSGLISAIAFLAVTAIIVVVVRDLTRAPVVLEEIVVPKDLAEQGYTGLVLSNVLWDQIAQIRNSDGFRKKEKTVRIQTASQQLDVVEPSSGLSLQRITQVMRSVLNLPQTRIAGEFVCPTMKCEPEEMTLTIRVFSGEGTNVITPGPIRDRTIVEYMHDTALRVMEQEIDPMVAAWYYYNTTPWGWKDKATAIATRTKLQGGQNAEEAAILLGFINIDTQDYTQALALGKEAIEIGDKYRLNQSGWPRRVWQHVVASFKSDDTDTIRAEALHLKGLASFYMDEPADGARFLADATKLAPDSAFLQGQHAFMLADLGEFKAASASSEQSTRLDPLTYYFWQDWGNALEQQGLTKEADEKYRMARNVALDRPWELWESGLIGLDEALSKASILAFNSPDDDWFWQELLVRKAEEEGSDAICGTEENTMRDFIFTAQESFTLENLQNAKDFAEEYCGWDAKFFAASP